MSRVRLLLMLVTVAMSGWGVAGEDTTGKDNSVPVVLQRALAAGGTGSTLALVEIAPFDWSRAYVFGPYTPRSRD